MAFSDFVRGLFEEEKQAAAADKEAGEHFHGTAYEAALERTEDSPLTPALDIAHRS